MDFSLRCEEAALPSIAEQYSYPAGDAQPESIGLAVKSRGHMTKSEFLEICAWKTQRSKSRCARNPSHLVEEATRLSLSADSEEIRIGMLMLLTGVDWATASVILHFCHHDRYPILDFRALWTVGIDKPPRITFQFWSAYTQFCRSIARRLGISMRELDRALWQYSKDHQQLAQSNGRP